MEYTGTIMEIDNNKAIVFTTECKMIHIHLKEDDFVGKQVIINDNDLCKENNSIIFNRAVKIAMSIAASLVLILGIAVVSKNLFNTPLSNSNATTAIVSVDINPGIELNIDQNNVITNVKYFNEEGRDVLSNIQIIDKPIIVGIKAIVSEAKKLGYIDENKNNIFIATALNNISKETNPDEFLSNIQSQLNSISTDLKDIKILSVVIENPDIIEKASVGNISLGKELLLSYALDNKIDLSDEFLRTANITELLTALNAIDENGMLSQAIIKKAAKVQQEQTHTTITTKLPPQSDVSDATTNITTEATITKAPETNVTESKAPETKKPIITTEKPTPDSQDEDESEINPKITVYTLEDGTIKVLWTPLSNPYVTFEGKKYNNFEYYKIVASENNPNPIYPEDGYLSYHTSTNTSKWVANPNDYGLQSGKTYYFSITYCFGNGKFTSDTVKVTIPKKPTVTDDSITPKINKVSINDTDLLIEWTATKGSTATYNGKKYTGFLGYKVVMSETNQNPIYDKSLKNDTFGYHAAKDYKENKSQWPYLKDKNGVLLELNKTYYVAVTYVFESGNFSTSGVKFTMPTK